jgi:glutamine synthetase
MPISGSADLTCNSLTPNNSYGNLAALGLPRSASQMSLDNMSGVVFDDATMESAVGRAVFNRFKASLVSGEPTPDGDKKTIADAMFKWARSHGAIGFAHWFFPMRGGGGAPGGTLGALKQDAFIDLDWSSKQSIKPFEATFPAERLFVGETDGSSFPNGGLRCTHRAAAFTTWDRGGQVVIYDKIMRIPCAFVTHLGDSIDEKTPLLRSQDAVSREGLRLLKNVNIATDATTVHSYLGWEQEFFVVTKEAYSARPDLVNCGRTLIGAKPARGQQQDLNYFGPIPARVETLLHTIQDKMIQMGCPMSVAHNEVAPGQHEMSPIYCVANASADYNVLFMEVAAKEASLQDLVILFHEKPFAGINGSGKHANWSVGTDTGLNFFHPGKDDAGHQLFITGVACLAAGLGQNNELVRCAVAGAGNDHRLGAQEAPPAIMSVYPGTGVEEHLKSIIAGGPLLGYEAKSALADLKSRTAMAAPTNAEDRNRTAPFPWCGNRFEFRAVGSSQNCSFPVAICNTIMAAGMAALSDRIEAGQSHRDAVAALLEQNIHAVFTGNGYSDEWQVEAEQRGLPNLRTTPVAVATLNSEKAKATFEQLGIMSSAETDARTEVMYENYNSCIRIEADTMVSMVETGIIPACAKDLAIYKDAPMLAGKRPELYASIVTQLSTLKELCSAMPEELVEQAGYLCETVKPQMDAVRKVVDEADGLIEGSLYPYPTYETLVYSHHS